MKLLNPKQVKDIKQEAIQSKTTEIAKLDNAINVGIKGYVELEAELKEKKEKLENEYTTIIVGLEKRVKELTNLVANLEVERQKALEPIDKELNELKDKQAYLELQKIENETLKKEIQDVIDIKEMKKNELDIKMQECSESISDLNIKITENNDAIKLLNKEEKRVNRLFYDFKDNRDKQEKWFKKENQEIKYKQDQLENDNRLLKENELDLTNREKKLESRQQTLKLAIEEAREKGIW